jgi:hypothetical protein
MQQSDDMHADLESEFARPASDRMSCATLRRLTRTRAINRE